MRVRDLIHHAAEWPDLDEELGDWSGYLQGKVLNAGGGSREVAGLIDGELVNLDIADGPTVDICAPLHEIPLADASFDSILCNAVLEHVENPHDVMDELYRVLRPGGAMVLVVPFMQPEHKVPTDYQRYTMDGLCRIAEDHGFIVERAEPLHNVYLTLAWIAEEWLLTSASIRSKLLRLVIFPPLRYLSRRSTRQVPTIASAHRILARRPVAEVAT